MAFWFYIAESKKKKKKTTKENTFSRVFGECFILRDYNTDKATCDPKQWDRPMRSFIMTSSRLSYLEINKAQYWIKLRNLNEGGRSVGEERK